MQRNAHILILALTTCFTASPCLSFFSSDEALAEKSFQVYTDAYEKYKILLEKLTPFLVQDERYNDPFNIPEEQESALFAIAENLFAQDNFANKIGLNPFKTIISPYLLSITMTTSPLAYYRWLLRKRLPKITAAYGTNNQTYIKINGIFQKLEQLDRHLNLLHEVLNQHKHYFVSYSTAQRAANTYHIEFSILEEFPDNQTITTNGITTLKNVITQEAQSPESIAKKFDNYLNDLLYTIETLEKEQEKLSFSYSSLIELYKNTTEQLKRLQLFVRKFNYTNSIVA